MFHGRPYGIRAGPTMEEGDSANASQLRSLATDFTWNYFFFHQILNVVPQIFNWIPLMRPFLEMLQQLRISWFGYWNLKVKVDMAILIKWSFKAENL